MRRIEFKKGGRVFAAMAAVALWSLAWAMALSPGVASAFPYTESTELFSETGTASEKFGSEVAVSGNGNLVAIGSPGAFVNGMACGAVTTFIRSSGSWSRLPRTVPTNCADGQQFGSAIALSADGTKMVVGAFGSESAEYFSRSGQIWTRTTGWSQSTVVTMHFGRSVAMSSDGRRVVIGAPLYANSGRAFVYHQNPDTNVWSSSYLLGSSNGYAYRELGFQVAMNSAGTRILTGAPGSNGAVSSAESFAWQPEYDRWKSGDPIYFSSYENARVGAGMDMATAGDFAVYGAPATASGKGSMVPFRYSSSLGWTYDAIEPSEYPGTSTADALGTDVATSGAGQLILAGTPGASGGVGAVRAYKKVVDLNSTSWNEATPIGNPAQTAGDQFGSAVAISDDGKVAVVGAPGADRASTTDRGAAFIEEVVGFQLSVSRTGSGTITSSPTGINCGITCSTFFPEGQAATLTATPAYGQAFSGWTGACSGTGTCHVTMSTDRNVQATFAAAPSSVTVTKKGLGSGVVTSGPAGINCGQICTSNFNYGEAVSLTAAPAADATFNGWGGDCASWGDDTTCVTDATGARQVTAEFKANPKRIVVQVEGQGSGTVSSNPTGMSCAFVCVGEYAFGSAVTITAKPSSGSTFKGWGGECVSSSTSCRIYMTSDKSLSVTFGAKNTQPVKPTPPDKNRTKVCGTLPGNGAYRYTQARGISCGKAARVTNQAKRKFCRTHNNCRTGPPYPRWKTYRGKTNTTGWSCQVMVKYEKSRVTCRRGNKLAVRAVGS